MNATLIKINSDALCKVHQQKTQDIKAKIAVSYDYNQQEGLLLNYLIKISDNKLDYLICECSYEISDYDINLDEKTIANEAVIFLQDRIETIISLISSEMGLKVG